MSNVVMIQCLNISTVFSFTSTLAIHSQGQAQRQQHETHECECVLPTREPAVQPQNIHDRLIAQGSREDTPELQIKKGLHRNFS